MIADRAKAVAELKELIRIETAVVHAVNSNRGLTKKLSSEEHRQVAIVFEAMTGFKITDKEFEEILG